MGIEELATVVMGELGWINMCLVGITLICLIGFIFTAYKFKQLKDHLDGVEDILDSVRYRVEQNS